VSTTCFFPLSDPRLSPFEKMFVIGFRSKKESRNESLTLFCPLRAEEGGPYDLPDQGRYWQRVPPLFPIPFDIKNHHSRRDHPKVLAHPRALASLFFSLFMKGASPRPVNEAPIEFMLLVGLRGSLPDLSTSRPLTPRTGSFLWETIFSPLQDDNDVLHPPSESVPPPPPSDPRFCFPRNRILS